MPADNASLKLISDDASKKIADALTKEVAPATSGNGMTYPKTAGPLVPPVEEAKNIKAKEAEYDAFDPEGEYAEEAKAEAKKQADADAAAKAAKDAEDAKKVETAKPAHSDRLMRLAATYGFSRAEAESMTSEQLRNSVAEAKMEVETQELIARRKAPVPVDTKVAPEAPKEDDIDWGEIETYDAAGAVNGKRKATEADVHPAMVKVIKDQRAVLKQIQARQSQMDRSEEFAIIDRAFAEDGKKFAAILGDMPAIEFDENNADHQLMMKRRMAVLKTSGVLMSDTPAAKQRKITAARNALFGAMVAAIPAVPVAPPPPPPPATAKLPPPTAQKTEKEKEWEAGALTAPTANNGKVAKGREAAYKQYDQIFERVKQRDGDKEDGEGDAELDEFGFPAPRYN